jgi:hypothetical protein
MYTLISTGTSTTTSTCTTPSIDTLRANIAGEVLTADEPGFVEACTSWNVRFVHAPAVVVIAADVGDIAEAVRYAHATASAVTVQATGHGASRTASDGVLIVTSRLTDVTIDTATLTAHVAAGAKWGAVLAPAQEHGLAPLLGSTTDVGAIGYTLGGGMGWLGRRYGLAADSVRSFDVVLADGSEVRASEAENAELFWALRGGGGAFGVITGMTIELYPVTTVYAGNLLYPIEMAGEVIRRYRDWVRDGLDERFTSSVSIMNFPPMEEVPEPIRGKSFVIIRGCWVGDLFGGQALVDQWRKWRTPALDMFGPIPFTMADTISNDPVDPLPAVVTTEWFDTLSDEAIDVLVDAGTPRPGVPPMLLFAELRHAGGAIRRNAAGRPNARGRSGELLLEMVALAFGPEHEAMVEEFITTVRGALAPYVTGAAYLNFLEGEEKHERGRAAYSPTALARMAAVKHAVDPADAFRNALALPVVDPAAN